VKLYTTEYSVYRKYIYLEKITTIHSYFYSTEENVLFVNRQSSGHFQLVEIFDVKTRKNYLLASDSPITLFYEFIAKPNPTLEIKSKWPFYLRKDFLKNIEELHKIRSMPTGIIRCCNDEENKQLWQELIRQQESISLGEIIQVSSN